MHNSICMRNQNQKQKSSVISLLFATLCSQIHRKRLVVCDWSDYLDRHLEKIVEYAHCYTAPAPILVAKKSNSNKRMTNTSKNCKHSQIMHASFPHFVTSSYWSEVAVFQTSLISCLSSFFYYSTFGALFFCQTYTLLCLLLLLLLSLLLLCTWKCLYWTDGRKNKPVPTSFCMRSDFSFLSWFLSTQYIMHKKDVEFLKA